MSECKNCGAELQGPWCHGCGQRAANLERPFPELLGDLLRETFDLDGRAVRTFGNLFLRPGLLTSEFLAGRRRLFTPPLRLYLFISVTFFIAMAWVASQGLLLDQGQTLSEDAAAQARFLSEELPRLMFVLLPVFALCLKAVLLSRLYFEHLVFSVHLHSAAYVVLAMMLPFEGAAATNVAALLAQALALLYLVVYIVVALRRVYLTGWFGAVWRTVVVLFAYMIIVSVAIEATSNFLIISD